MRSVGRLASRSRSVRANRRAAGHASRVAGVVVGHLGHLRHLGDEPVAGAQQAGVAEVQDGPQVSQAVLDGSAREGHLAAGVEATKLLRGLAGRILDGLGLVEDHRGPLHLLEHVEVAHNGAVGGHHKVGALDHGGDARRGRAVRAVVDHHLQPRHEPAGLGGPVAHHGGRRGHQTRAVAASCQQVGQHRRGLAQPHVEGQAAAQPGLLQEAQPHQRVGLVGAQRAVEALGPGGELGGYPAGASDQVGGPSLPCEHRAARQRRALQAEGVAQHVGAGHAGDVGPLGERGCGLVEVDPVELHPAAPTLHEGTGLGSKVTDLRCGQLDVVEGNRPADVGQLAGPDNGFLRLDRGQAQRRCRAAARQCGDPHLVAQRLQQPPGLGHQLPGLVGVEDHLAAPAAPEADKLREEALEAGHLVLHRLAAGPRRDHQGPLHRLELARAGLRQHRQVPGPDVVGRVELHDQAQPALEGLGHRAGPLVQSPRQVRPVAARRVEAGAVEAGQGRLGHVGLGARNRRRRRRVEALGRLAGDGVDDVGEGRLGESGRVALVLEGGRGARQRLGQRLHRVGLDDGGRPAHQVAGCVGSLSGARGLRGVGCVGPGAASHLLELGDHAALGRQPHRQRGHQAQPRHADPDALGLGGLPERHQPAETALDRCGDPLRTVPRQEASRAGARSIRRCRRRCRAGAAGRRGHSRGAGPHRRPRRSPVPAPTTAATPQRRPRGAQRGCR